MSRRPLDIVDNVFSGDVIVFIVVIRKVLLAPWPSVLTFS